MKYEELRNLKSNLEVKDYLNKKSKQSLVDYYFKNLPTAIDKHYYLRKSKEHLVNIIYNHYIFIRRDEELNNIKV